MLQLVYISSSKQPVSDAALQDILAASRRNNDRSGVSGLLVAGGRRFLQVLEGPADAVTATFARIKTDQRHRACVVLSSREIAERGFGTWSMACERGVESSESDLLSVVTDLTSGLADLNVQAQFVGFARLHAQA